MTSVTPSAAAPSHERRRLLVAEAMGVLDGVEQLPVREQLGRLSDAQSVLSAVLNNQPAPKNAIVGTSVAR